MGRRYEKLALGGCDWDPRGLDTIVSCFRRDRGMARRESSDGPAYFETKNRLGELYLHILVSLPSDWVPY